MRSLQWLMSGQAPAKSLMLKNSDAILFYPQSCELKDICQELAQIDTQP